MIPVATMIMPVVKVIAVMMPGRPVVHVPPVAPVSPVVARRPPVMLLHIMTSAAVPVAWRTGHSLLQGHQRLAHRLVLHRGPRPVIMVTRTENKQNILLGVI